MVQLAFKSSPFSGFLRYFFISSAFLLLPIFFFSYLYFYQDHQNQKEMQFHAESLRLELATSTISRSLSTIISDIHRLSTSLIISDFLVSPDEFHRSRLEQSFKNFILHTHIYDQVRIIDHNGYEIARVNYNNGMPVTVPRPELQNKSSRYYFQQASLLQPDQLFISELDLNIENGRIEKPYKPMLRVASPLYDKDNKFRGILILNHLAQTIIDQFKEIMQPNQGSSMIVNKNGSFIYHPNSDLQWGKLLGHEKNISDLFPASWPAIQNTNSHSLKNEDGLFIFRNISPVDVNEDAIHLHFISRDGWKLISHIPTEMLQFSYLEKIQNNKWTSLALSLVVIFISLLISVLKFRSLQNSAELTSKQDSLNEAQKIAHIGNWVWNIDEGTLFWSDEIFRIFGFKPNQFTPTYNLFLESVHPDDRPALTDAIQKALAGIKYDINHRIILPDSSVRYVREKGEVQFSSAGTPVTMTGTVQDITETYLAYEALHKRQKQIISLMEQAPDGIFVADFEGRFTEINSAACELLGYQHSEIIGKTVTKLLKKTDHHRLKDAREVIEKGQVHVSEWLLRHKDGELIPVEVSAKILDDGNWQAFVRDVRERRKTEEETLQAAAVFNNTSEAILVTDSEGTIIRVNRAYTNMTGYSSNEAIGRTSSIHRSDRHDVHFYRKLWDRLLATDHWQGEIWNQRKNGDLYPAWETISAVRNASGELTNYVSVISDISAIKEAEEKLNHLAHHDALTQLPNRMAFMISIEQAIQYSKRHHIKMALLFLDLDRFKMINDTLGHDVGDDLLMRVSRILKQNVRSEDIVARLGGDEFTILMQDINHPEDASVLAAKIIQALAEPFNINHHMLTTSTSIGISIYPDDATTVTDLLKTADTAMYRAKHNGRNAYEYYTSELTEHAMQRLELEHDLRNALNRHEFTLHYQPQIDVKSGKITGVEALIRWNHPRHGIVLPDSFIHIAEESGLIDDIGSWVIRHAIKQLKSWQDKGIPLVRMGVNMSGHQIIYDHLVQTVRDSYQKNEFNTDDIQFELEITESILQSGQQAVANLSTLRQMGISIAIDDFGTGYSSLSHLKHLPVDTLKIDRSFLTDIPNNRDNTAITDAIISLAKSMGLKVIAEGIETPEQMAYLQQKGCDEAQGFLVSKPVDGEKMEKLLLSGSDTSTLLQSGSDSNSYTKRH